MRSGRTVVGTTIATTSLIALAVLCASGSVMAAQDEFTAPRTDLVILPYANYGSDLGLGLGLNGALYLRDFGWSPYRYAMRAQAYATTGGLQNHTLGFDAPRLAGSFWRPQVELGYFREAHHPYYGPGNRTDPPVPPGQDPDSYLAFDLRTWHGAASAHATLAPGWNVGGQYSLRLSSVDAAPTSLLRKREPVGAHGGTTSQVEAEVNYDTRDIESMPIRGSLMTLALRLAEPLIGSTFRFAGATLALHRYQALFDLGPRLVVAGRVVFDGVVGDVPVELMPRFGGHVPALEGLGGDASVRGLDRFRYTGKVRLFGNGEIRSRLARFYVGVRSLDVWITTFCDVGRVWANWAPDGPLWLVHASAGGGVRLAWVEDYVLRFDAGRSEGGWRMYVEFGQAF